MSKHKYVKRFTSDCVQHSELKWLEKMVYDIKSYKNSHTHLIQDDRLYVNSQVCASKDASLLNKSIKAKRVENLRDENKNVKKKFKVEVMNNKENKQASRSVTKKQVKSKVK